MASNYKSQLHDKLKLFIVYVHTSLVGNEPNDWDIIKVAEKISATLESSNTQWEKFGMVLLHTKNKDELTMIEGNSESFLEKCKGLLNLWKKNTSNPKWEEVIQALREVNLNNLATELQTAIVTEQPKSSCTSPAPVGEHHHQVGDEQFIQGKQNCYTIIIICIINGVVFKPGAREGWRVPGFLKLLLSVTSVCLCVCVCVCVPVPVPVPVPKAINYIHVILNMYNQLNKFVVFRNVMKLSMHERGLSNEARRDRNQSNKTMLAP